MNRPTTHFLNPSHTANLLSFASAFFVAVLLITGCKKSSPPEETSSTNQNLQLHGTHLPSMPAPRQTASVARFHWVGHTALTTDPTAAYLMQIWNLPESAKVQDLFETKTAAAIAGVQTRAGTNRAQGTNAPSSEIVKHGMKASALLKPLIADLLENECYFEARQATNDPIEVSVAVKLDSARASLWQTNLAAFLASQYQALSKPVLSAAGQGTQFRIQGPPPKFPGHSTNWFISVARSGEWTALSIELADKGDLLGQLLSSFPQDRPAANPARRPWLEANFEPSRLLPVLGLGSPESPTANFERFLSALPRVSLIINGDATNVITQAQMNFREPLPFEVEPWNIPTNLILGELHSFTAVQGFRPWLASSKLWQDFQLGPPPNQLFLWANKALAQMTYFAAPLPHADVAVSNASARLMNKNPWFTNNTMGGFKAGPYGSGLDWVAGTPLAEPFFESAKAPQGEFIRGGIARGTPDPQLLHATIRDDLFSKTNLVYYDREITGAQVEGWIFNGQFLRLVCYKAQLPPDSASMALLKILSKCLGDSGTMVTKTGPAQLTLFRRSPIGFTGFELHLLADWLESPAFPRGLHTFTAPGIHHFGAPKQN